MARSLGVLCLAAALAVPSTASAQPAPPAEKPAPAKPKPKPDQPPAAQPPAAQPAPGQPPAAQPAQPPAAQPAPGQPVPPAGAPPAGQPGAPPPTGVQPGQAPAGQPGEPLIAPEQPQAPPPVAPPPVQTPAPDPDRDAKALAAQGAERPTGQGELGTRRSEVYAEDWWSHARPTFELHGYYRLRAELFHNFALGRKDVGASVIWAQPPDNFYVNSDGDTPANLQRLCGAEADTNEICENNTQAGANMRFRLNPELHISDNVRILSQVDLLDNLVLGSTPDGYTNQPGAGGGYQLVGRPSVPSPPRSGLRAQGRRRRRTRSSSSASGAST